MSNLGPKSPGSLNSPRGYSPVGFHRDEHDRRSRNMGGHGNRYNSEKSPLGSPPYDDGLSPKEIGISRRTTRDFQRRYGDSVQPPQWPQSPHPDGLQTHYGTMNDAAQSHMARKHSSRRQFFQLLKKILLRWFASFLLSLGMMLTFYQFEKVKVLDKSEKRWFNALSTGLYLTLGLNLAGSFKGMATIVRWKLLSRKQHKLQEVDFILGLSSLIKVFHFGLHSFKHRRMQSFLCFLWIFVNCVGRLSVALTGLTYSYDSADAFFSTPGIVAISDFSYFWPSNNITGDLPELGAEYSTAHSWGLSSILLGSAERGSPHFDQYVHVLETHGGDWAYYFREYNPSNQVISHKSDRYVTVKSECDYFPIIKGQDGLSSTVTYINGTEEVTLEGIDRHAPGITTWINVQSDDDHNTDYYCGPRCAGLAALQFLPYDKHRSPNSTEYGAFFKCSVDISYVQNAKVAAHNFPDRMAVIAAGAIGSEGYSMAPQSANWTTVGYYPGTTWGERVGTNAVRMAQLAGKFACGVIAARDQFGSATVMEYGDKPWVGVLLKIKWPETIAILGGILLCQLILGLATIMYATTVICKDDSYLSTARLLRPLVERLGPNGCYLSGPEISNTFDGDMVYGVRSDPSGARHHLDIGEDIAVQPHFPEGWYDGEESSMYPQSAANNHAVRPSLEVSGKVINKKGGQRARKRRFSKKVRRVMNDD